MTSPQQPAERPNSSFVKHTRTGFDARPMVSILVREDDPRDPDRPQRWRSVEGRSGWFTWEQLDATGTVEPLFTSAEVAAAAASQQQHRQATVQTASAQWSRDQYHWRAAAAAGRPRRGDLRLLAAVADGTVQLYGTHRPAMVQTATMRLHRDSLQVIPTAGAAWRALGLTRVDQRVGRLVDAGLIAQPLQRGRPGTPAGNGDRPYLLTQAGVDVLDRHRPDRRRGHEWPPLTVESLLPQQPSTRGVTAGAMAGASGGGPGLAGPGVHTEIIEVGDAPGNQPAPSVASGAPGQPQAAASRDAPQPYQPDGRRDHAAGTVDLPTSPSFAAGPDGTTTLAISTERSFASARRVLAQAPRTDDDRLARLTVARDQLRDPSTRARWDAHRAARPQPGQAGNPPSTSTGTPPPRRGPATRDLGGPRR